MPHEGDTPCPTPEINLKNQHRKPHTICTMDGNDQDPKPCLEIPPPQTLYTPQRKIDGKTKERTTQCPMNEIHPAPHSNSISKINTENPIPAAQWRESIKIQNRAWKFHHRRHYTPPQKHRRKNDRGDDTMPHEGDTPCPTPENNPKNHDRKPHFHHRRHYTPHRER